MSDGNAHATDPLPLVAVGGGGGQGQPAHPAARRARRSPTSGWTWPTSSARRSTASARARDGSSCESMVAVVPGCSSVAGPLAVARSWSVIGGRCFCSGQRRRSGVREPPRRDVNAARPTARRRCTGRRVRRRGRGQAPAARRRACRRRQSLRRDAAGTGRRQRQRGHPRAADRSGRRSECAAHRRQNRPDDRGAVGERRRPCGACSRHGADVNAREPWQGETALMWAAGENHAAVGEAADRARRRTGRAIDRRLNFRAVRRA